MEPEILTYEKVTTTDSGTESVILPLAIGFYFESDNEFEKYKFRVFLPHEHSLEGRKTNEKTWLFAKMHALSTDANVHESCKHLGMGHMYCESFAIAYHNHFVHKKDEK